MKRHSIVCRLGGADRAKVSVVEKDSTITSINFNREDGTLKFGIGNVLDTLEHLGVAPHESAIDLAVLGALVFCADTRVSRADHSQDGWTREIDLYLPVFDPIAWSVAHDSLIKGLNFLTGDRWRVFFRPRPKSSRVLAKPVQGQFHSLTCACLFSGGLDSFIGGIDLLKSGEQPLLISHHADGITSKHQNICRQWLKERFGESAWKSVDAYVSFSSEAIEEGGQEDTQRSRSFLFFALGVLGASSLGKATTLYVPENGLIALNAPLDPLRVGALSTRTTHPYFMRRFEDAVSALGINVTLKNPYRHHTKGEMAQECQDRDFLKAKLKDTMSCSSPAKGRWKKQPNGHCGYCVPCIIRKASVLAAFASDETTYTVPDLSAVAKDSAKAEGRNIRSFLLAIRRLRANPNLAKIMIHASGPLSEFADEWADYAAMYARGMAEVDSLLNPMGGNEI
jgi:hypothetical protein